MGAFGEIRVGRCFDRRDLGEGGVERYAKALHLPRGIWRLGQGT
jgi:hypothetical protein